MNNNKYFGKNNSNWKGDNISMRAKHYRLEAKKGKASDHLCVHCKKCRASDWAETGKGYIPLCRSCHNKLDDKIKNIQKHDSRYNHSLREEVVNLVNEQ